MSVFHVFYIVKMVPNRAKRHINYFKSNPFNSFLALDPFYTPWKNQKISGFMTFSEVKKETTGEMFSLYRNWSVDLHWKPTDQVVYYWDINLKWMQDNFLFLKSSVHLKLHKIFSTKKHCFPKFGSNDIVVRAISYQSRGLVLKITRWYQCCTIELNVFVMT